MKKFQIPESSMRNGGFTLMELMVVIAIIVLLAGIMVPNLAGRIEKAKITKAEADIAAIEGALAMYETDTGRYPPTTLHELKDWLTGVDTGTGVDVNAPEAKNWHGPYIKGIEQDPWKQDYVYLKNEHPRDICPGSPPACNQVDGTDYPKAGDGSWVAPARNLSYYIYSMGRDNKTSNSTGGDSANYESTFPTAHHDHNDDINNWDVNKSWREAK